MYVFADDVALLREEVIKIQVKVALGSTSILLCAIKSSLRAGKGELIGGRCNGKYLVYGGENYITKQEILPCFSRKKNDFISCESEGKYLTIKLISSHYNLQECCNKIGENGPGLSKFLFLLLLLFFL